MAAASASWSDRLRLRVHASRLATMARSHKRNCQETCVKECAHTLKALQFAMPLRNTHNLFSATLSLDQAVRGLAATLWMLATTLSFDPNEFHGMENTRARVASISPTKFL